MRTPLLLAAAAALQFIPPIAGANAADARTVSNAKQGSLAALQSIDYEAYDIILGAIVFEVGRSDRQPARGGTQRTGTRISLDNPSRYRYEANRVAFHLLTDEQRAEISAYRIELEGLASRLDWARFSPDEELAFWLNLHNLVVIDELAKQYPVRRMNRLRIDDTGFWDAPLIVLNGRRISLNELRFQVVGERWPDPRVMYGFFSGAVGGPTLQGEAFTGDRVWSQLSASAREFVNALRGVESLDRGFKVSPVFEEWRAIIFPAWPDDFRAHLAFYAESEVSNALAVGGAPGFLRYDYSIADLTNGVGRCGGGAVANVVSYGGGAGVPTTQDACAVLPLHAAELIEVVIERRLEFLRQGRMGSVTVRDIPTVDPDEPVRPRAARPGARPEADAEPRDR